jgi:hypothetical protein
MYDEAGTGLDSGQSAGYLSSTIARIVTEKGLNPLIKQRVLQEAIPL